MPGTLSPVVFRAGELLSYSAGLLLTGFFVSQLAMGEVERRQDIASFEQAVTNTANPQTASTDSVNTSPQPEESIQFASSQAGAPDTALWAAGRIADYQSSMQGELPKVLGLLEIPSVGLKVPVYPSDTDLNMDRGAGVIDGMAYPHEPGNIGIAGHRDGYFRVLKDVKSGDTIKLQTLEGPKQFTIDSIQIVEISDLSVLQDTDDQTITLVTCYPFYFVGHAPQRYIVTASLDITDVNQQ
jgi:sortase A